MTPNEALTEVQARRVAERTDDAINVNRSDSGTAWGRPS